MIEKKIEEWVDHIINRFGKYDALLWATSKIIHDCPCILLKWKCLLCEHRIYLGMGAYWCEEANRWVYLNKTEILEIKSLISKKLI